MNSQDRVSSERNLLNKLGKAHGLGGNTSNHGNAGRQPGTKDLSPFMREIIASAANLDTAPAVAKTFGISKAHAHNLKHGYVTRPEGKDEALVKGTRKVLDDVHRKAADIVMECLGLVTPAKLKEIESVREIVGVAKDMSSIVEKTAPPEQKGVSNKLEINIYAPGTLNLEDFDIIDVESKEIA
jgi:hypothetical protein